MDDTLRATVESVQTCAACHSSRVKATVVTTMVVYFRCSDCGDVWSIQERRTVPRLAAERAS